MRLQCLLERLDGVAELSAAVLLSVEVVLSTPRGASIVELFADVVLSAVVVVFARGAVVLLRSGDVVTLERGMVVLVRSGDVVVLEIDNAAHAAGASIRLEFVSHKF